MVNRSWRSPACRTRPAWDRVPGARQRMLWNGWFIWLGAAPLRSVAGDRRTTSDARPAVIEFGHTRDRRRVQLPGADRAGDRASRDASGRGRRHAAARCRQRPFVRRAHAPAGGSAAGCGRGRRRSAIHATKSKAPFYKSKPSRSGSSSSMKNVWSPVTEAVASISVMMAAYSPTCVRPVTRPRCSVPMMLSCTNG
jgi:hypothetical protein